MKYFDWSSEKNKKLVVERDVCFEDIVVAIEDGRLLEVLIHENQDKYQGQKIFIVDIAGYAYLVPFVEDDEKIFLKTIFPSRKATKKYILKIKD